LNVIKTSLGLGVVALSIWAINRAFTGAVPEFPVFSSEPDQVDGTLPIFGLSQSAESENTLRNWKAPPAAAPYLEAIAQAEARYGLPKNLLARQLQQESGYKPEIISGKQKSAAGAIGIAQFMPATAKDFGIDPTNPWQSIDAAGKYMKQLYNRFGAWDLALAAYNWGLGNLGKKGIDKAPAETRNYFTKILADIGLIN
jgi:soluble lytic murein transglycosylase-like protein